MCYLAVALDLGIEVGQVSVNEQRDVSITHRSAKGV